MLAGDPIDATQAALGLRGRDEVFAEVLGVTESALRSAREGDDAEHRKVVEAAALVLGVEVYELADGDIVGRANTVLLKSIVNPETQSIFPEAVAQGVHHDLGCFARELRRAAWMKRALGDPLPTLPDEVATFARPTPPSLEAPYGADALALRLRERLGLGLNPIESVVALVRDRLGIAVHATRSLWSAIDGAAYAFGGVRGILVNRKEDPPWFSARMTIAHELCHVLFDGDALEGARSSAMLLYSPAQRDASRPRRRASERPREANPFQLREQRSNAFAAYLIAPPNGVRAMFGADGPPVRLSSVDRLAEYYGLSRRTAINVLTNVYDWSEDDRRWLLEWSAEAEPLAYHRRFSEQLPEAGDAAAALRPLADEAVKLGRMSAAMRDRWFGLTNTHDSTPALEGDHPSGFWTDRRASEASSEILRLYADRKIDAALRVLWDSMRDWVEAENFDRVRSLVGDLSPVKVDDHIALSVLTLLKSVPELATERAGYEQSLRTVRADQGHSTQSIEALLARFAS